MELQELTQSEMIEIGGGLSAYAAGYALGKAIQIWGVLLMLLQTTNNYRHLRDFHLNKF